MLAAAAPPGCGAGSGAMTAFDPRNPNFEARVRSSFARQRFMEFIGAELGSVDPGAVSNTLPFRDELCQQHGFFHGGVIGTLADNVGGYAAFSLMAAADSSLTVEFKLNLLAPATGETLVAKGVVVRSGRSGVDGAAGGRAHALVSVDLFEVGDRDRPHEGTLHDHVASAGVVAGCSSAVSGSTAPTR